MSDTPTPRTDAKITEGYMRYDEYVVPAYLSYELERELAAMTATAEDYRKQACTPDNCRRKEMLRQATAIRDELIRKVRLALLDAISVFTGKGQTVTTERIEAWQAAVKFLDEQLESSVEP